MSIVISDTVRGSEQPQTTEYPKKVINCDFLIEGKDASSPIGDGVDDTTTWEFDFTADPAFPDFTPSRPLTSALLTLTLTPKYYQINTDLVKIKGLDPIFKKIRELLVDVTSTITLQLLDFYSSRDILEVFDDNAGKIPMVYKDDAIVSFARLDLTQGCSLKYAIKFILRKIRG